MNRTFFTFIATLFVALAMAEENPVAPLQYDMTFKGRGETTVVQTVTVENLTLGTFLELSGSDVLRLTNTPSQGNNVEEVSAVKVYSIIYPNPSFGATSLVFANRAAGNVKIAVTDISGRTLTSNTFNLETGKQTAVLPAMPQGQYIVTLSGKGINESVKWVSTGGGTGGTIRMESNASAPVEALAATFSPTSGNTQKSESYSPIQPTSTVYFPVFPPQLRAANANTVEMEYHDGELLRFTGVSGNRTTIVMNIPTLSHDIAFDFYECKDAAGRHYPIVNAGGLLWMAEDLSGCPEGVTQATAAGDWNSATPTMAYLDYSDANANAGGYYNHAAAKIALPEGWYLPTAGDVDAMLAELGGYDTPEKKLAVAELLKSREAWSGIASLDSISFGAGAAGIVGLDGSFSEQDASVNYWTRSTKNLVPIFWQLNETEGITFNASNTADAKYGYRIRGCRPAPSAYKDIMDPIMAAAGYNAPQQRAATATSAFESGPLGGTYRYMLPEPQKILANLHNAPIDQIQLYSCTNGIMNSIIGDQQMLKPTTSFVDLLERGVAVNYASKPSSMVVLRIEEMDMDWLIPEGRLDQCKLKMQLIFYSNKVDRVIDLPQSLFSVLSCYQPGNGNTYETNSTLVYGWSNYFPYILSLQGPNKERVNDTRIGKENAVRHIQLLAADFTGDSNDELVLVCNHKVYVFNAETGAIISEKTFPAPVRADVGDADGDVNPDITVAYLVGIREETAQTQIEIYHNGDLTAEPVATATAPISILTDIKTGNLLGNGKSQLLVYTRKAMVELDNMGTTSSSDDIYRSVYDTFAQVSVYEYNAGSLPLAKRFEIKQPTRGLGNNDLCLIDFSGANGKQDLVAGNKIYRYNPLQDNFSVEHEFMLNKNQIGNPPFTDYEIPEDNIKAGYINSANSLGFELIYNVYYNATNGMGVMTPYFATRTFGCYDGVFSEKILKEDDKIIHYHSGANRMGNSNPYIVLYNTNYPKKILEYRSHATTMSEPRIYALLAAPPFFKYDRAGNEYQYGNFGSMGTSWGKSEVVGNSKSNGSSSSTSFIFGFEFQYEAPVIGVPLGGIDIEFSMESEITNSTEKSYTTTQSVEFTTSQQDVVILSAAFYDTYTYEIVESENPDEIGGMLNISIPDAAGIRTMGLSLNDYERMMADNRHAPNLRQIFKHKEGFPFTYPNEALNGLAAMPFSGQEFVSTGSAASVNRAISLDESTAVTAGMSFSMDMKLVATAPGGVKAGAGFGSGTTSESTHSEGKGHSIAGNVLAPNSVFDNVPQFRWNVYWLKAHAGGQEFPVVYYVVKE